MSPAPVATPAATSRSTLPGLLGLGATLRAAPRAAAAGLCLWLIAVGFALRAQHLFTEGGAIDAGRVLFAVAALCAAAGVVLIDRSAPLRERPAPVVSLVAWSWSSARRIAATALIVTGAGASFATIPLIEEDGSHRVAALVWLGGIALLLAGAAVGARNPLRVSVRPSGRAAGLELSLVVGLLLLAVVLRLPNLGDIPPSVHGDEAAIGLEARRILAGGSIFSFGWYDVPSLSFAIHALTMAVFGDDLYGLRLASFVQGVLSILLLYLLVRRLFGTRVALLAGFLLAVSQWDVHFSRTGFHYMQAQLATLLVLYFLVRALDTRRALDFIATGLAIGLCFEVYFAARLAPLLAGVYLVYRAITERGFLRRHAGGFAAVVLGAAVFLAPMWAAVSQRPEGFSTRSNQVSLFTDENMRHHREAYGADSSAEVVRLHAQRTLEAFNLHGETSLQYGHRAPLLDFWSASLLPLGALLLLLSLHQSRYFLLASWIVLTLVIGVVLTIDAPFSPRMTGVIPAIMVLPALVLDAGWRGMTAVFGSAGQYAFALPVAAFLALSLGANHRDYFDRYVHREQPREFNTELSHYVLRTGYGYRYYLIGTNLRSLRYETQRFLIPRIDGVDVGPRPLALPLRRVPPRKGLVFVFEAGAPNVERRLGAVRRAYPRGRHELHRNRLGVLLFETYAVAAADAAR